MFGERGQVESYANNRNPYTGEVLVSHKLANREDVNEAYETAFRVQKEWISLSPDHRARIINAASFFSGQERRSNRAFKK